MIKMATNDSQSIFLGLSDRNLEMLRAGRPIIFPGAEIGIPGKQFCIFWGPTEEAMGEKILAAGIIGPDARAVIAAANDGKPPPVDSDGGHAD